jgi:hypothetical protein
MVPLQLVESTESSLVIRDSYQGVLWGFSIRFEFSISSWITSREVHLSGINMHAYQHTSAVQAFYNGGGSKFDNFRMVFRPILLEIGHRIPSS